VCCDGPESGGRAPKQYETVGQHMIGRLLGVECEWMVVESLEITMGWAIPMAQKVKLIEPEAKSCEAKRALDLAWTECVQNATSSKSVDVCAWIVCDWLGKLHVCVLLSERCQLS
jgi:hypothetical protein